MIESFKLPNITPETLTGSIVSFNDEYGGLPLKSCTSLIAGYQEGSGTPSPQNVRPLHAFSSANIGQTSGYSEYFRGLLNGTYGFVDLGSLSGWTYDSAYKYFWTTDLVFNHNAKMEANLLCPLYHIPPNYSEFSNVTKDMIMGVVFHAHQNALNIRNLAYTDANAFKAAMNGEYLIYELATPITPIITPEQFATLCQAFGITGNTYTFTFGQTIYQGSIDWKSGVVVATWGYIASYNGETLTGEWLCNKAPYEVGTTPPTGSQVTYELATPIEIPLGGINLLTQEGQNNIFCDTGDTEVKFLKVT